MKIKNKLTVTRGLGEGGSEGKKGRVKSKAFYKGLKVKDNVGED